MTIEVSPLRIKDREVKHLKLKEISGLKIVWKGPTGGIVMWDLESKMKGSYLDLFPSSNF